MDRELINRNIINIIDVKKCQNYNIFNTEDLYNVLKNYLYDLVWHDVNAMNYIDDKLESTKMIIDKIANNQNITIEEKNQLMSALMQIKRRYLM